MDQYGPKGPQMDSQKGKGREHIDRNKYYQESADGQWSCKSTVYRDQYTQGLIKTLGSMVIFDENQGVSDLSKYEFLCPIHVKIIKFLVI